MQKPVQVYKRGVSSPSSSIDGWSETNSRPNTGYSVPAQSPPRPDAHGMSSTSPPSHAKPGLPLLPPLIQEEENHSEDRTRRINSDILVVNDDGDLGNDKLGGGDQTETGDGILGEQNMPIMEYIIAKDGNGNIGQEAKAKRGSKKAVKGPEQGTSRSAKEQAISFLSVQASVPPIYMGHGPHSARQAQSPHSASSRPVGGSSTAREMAGEGQQAWRSRESRERVAVRRLSETSVRTPSDPKKTPGTRKSRSNKDSDLELTGWMGKDSGFKSAAWFQAKTKVFDIPRSDLPPPPSIPSRVPNLGTNSRRLPSKGPSRDSQRMLSPPRSPKSPKSAGGLSIVSIQTSMVEGCEIDGLHIERGLDEVEEEKGGSEQGGDSNRRTERKGFKSVESAMAYKRRADAASTRGQPVGGPFIFQTPELRTETGGKDISTTAVKKALRMRLGKGSADRTAAVSVAIPTVRIQGGEDESAGRDYSIQQREEFEYIAAMTALQRPRYVKMALPTPKASWELRKEADMGHPVPFSEAVVSQDLIAVHPQLLKSMNRGGTPVAVRSRREVERSWAARGKHPRGPAGPYLTETSHMVPATESPDGISGSLSPGRELMAAGGECASPKQRRGVRVFRDEDSKNSKVENRAAVSTERADRAMVGHERSAAREVPVDAHDGREMYMSSSTTPVGGGGAPIWMEHSIRGTSSSTLLVSPRNVGAPITDARGLSQSPPDSTLFGSGTQYEYEYSFEGGVPSNNVVVDDKGPGMVLGMLSGVLGGDSVLVATDSPKLSVALG